MELHVNLRVLGLIVIDKSILYDGSWGDKGINKLMDNSHPTVLAYRTQPVQRNNNHFAIWDHVLSPSDSTSYLN